MGSGKKSPYKGGIWLRKNKYVDVTPPNVKGTGVVYLSTKGGGACIGASAYYVCIAFWDSKSVMSDNRPQSAGITNQLVQLCIDELKGAGY